MKNKKILAVIKKSKDPVKLLKKWKEVFNIRKEKVGETKAIKSANAIIKSELLKEFSGKVSFKKRKIFENREEHLALSIDENTKIVFSHNREITNNFLTTYKGKVSHITEEYVKEVFRRLYDKHDYLPEENLYYAICDINENVEGAQLLFDKNGYKLYKVNTFEASKVLGKGTKWCISKRINDWEGYKEIKTDFYFFITPTTKWAIEVQKRFEVSIIWDASNVVQRSTGNIRSFVKKYKQIIPDIENAIGKKFITSGMEKSHFEIIKSKRQRLHSEIKYLINKYGEEDGRILATLCSRWNIHDPDQGLEVKKENGKLLVNVSNRVLVDDDVHSLKISDRIEVNKVHGSFICSGCGLKTLEGAPKIVIGNFVCNHNNLTSLKYGPEEVAGRYDCYNNNIRSLEGLPKKIGKVLNIKNNPIRNRDLDKHKGLKYER